MRVLEAGKILDMSHGSVIKFLDRQKFEYKMIKGKGGQKTRDYNVTPEQIKAARKAEIEASKSRSKQFDESGVNHILDLKFKQPT